MAKTKATLELEKMIWTATYKQGVFGCFEVTIGFRGNERVDYLTYDTKGIWRCYEIKVSKSDFHSKAHNTFLGHFNYYVMPAELYEQVKNEIPSHIGVYAEDGLIKKAKRQELQIDKQILKDSLIRSLYREYDKFIYSQDSDYLQRLKTRINRLEKESRYYHNMYIEHANAIYLICEHYNLDYDEVRKFVKKEAKVKY